MRERNIIAEFTLEELPSNDLYYVDKLINNTIVSTTEFNNLDQAITYAREINKDRTACAIVYDEEGDVLNIRKCSLTNSGKCFHEYLTKPCSECTLHISNHKTVAKRFLDTKDNSNV